MTGAAAQQPEVTLVRSAARMVVAVGRMALDAQLRHKAQLCLMDFLACCMEAQQTPVGRSIGRFAAMRQAAGRAAEAHYWGLPHKLDAETAAMANGMAGHSLIREDMHVGGGSHPGVAVLPAIMAIAQRERLDGASVLQGVVAAYQALCALGIAVRPDLPHRHFRPLGITGAFGAAAGVAAAMRVDETVAMHALALASNTAAGLNQWAWSGSEEIYLHAGMAARNGVAAFDLARAGILGSADILEGRDGLLVAYGGLAQQPQCQRMREALAQQWHLLDVRHKPVMGCNYVQTPVACAFRLRSALEGDTRRIASIRIETFSKARDYPGCNSAGPFSTPEQTKMSLQFAVAAALRVPELDDAAYQGYEDREQQRLVACTTLLVRDEFEHAAAGRQPARVVVGLNDGTTREHHLPDVPWLEAAAVRERFRKVAAQQRGSAAAIELVALLDRLDDLEHLDRLWALLAPDEA